MQAGIAQPNPETGKRYGPVLKTVVNREPRPSGPVIENWNGLDETGSYYIPDLPGFVMSVAATSLPESSVIATGNRSQTFLQRALTRTGSSLLTNVASNHRHHHGLTALEDVSPALRFTPANATWSGENQIWSTKSESLKGSLFLEGPSAQSFRKQPGHLEIFLDQALVRKATSPTQGMNFEVPLEGVSPGPHIVAFDWASEYGPTAATSIRLRVERNKPNPVSRETGR
jgi:hypothetical protein